MADSEPQTGKPSSSSLDLSSLQGISLGPKWGEGEISTPDFGERHTKEFDDRRGRRRDRGDQREGRAKGRPPPRGGRMRDSGDRRSSRDDGIRSGRRGDREEEPQFRPVVDVQFYPEEEPFKVLIHAVRQSLRTFELFEIARLILEKPERFVCLVKDPRQKEGEPALLFASVPDGLPFRSERDALNHVFQHHLDKFFNVETVEVDPPSGTFNVIHRCGVTGELIAPPNYHRYGALLKYHHAAKAAHLPFEVFQRKLESVKEEEATREWLDKMKQQTRFTLKTEEGQETKTFDNLEDARLHLVTHRKEDLIRPAYSARFSGRDLNLLNPNDAIRQSIEFHWQRQLRFPLDTANHLRGRLRRLNLAVYKKGSKGVSYVCAVKRNFRVPGQPLADNLEELITFIEAHPRFPAKELPKSFLGIGDAGGAEVDEDQQKRLKDLKLDLKYLITEGFVIEYSDGGLYVPPPRDDAGDDDGAPKKKKSGKPRKSKSAEKSSPEALPESVPEDVQPDKVQPDNVQPDQAEPDKVQPDQAEPDEVVSEDVEPDKVKPDEEKVADRRSEDSDSGESKPGNPAV